MNVDSVAENFLQYMSNPRVYTFDLWKKKKKILMEAHSWPYNIALTYKYSSKV